MNIQRIAAFTDNNQGGNPAGVVLQETMPDEALMLATAKQVGYSETAFAHPYQDGFRIRYFAPETEIPFCGHATIATAAALGMRDGADTYPLYLNDGKISVTCQQDPTGVWQASLQSPKTWSKAVAPQYFQQLLQHFSLTTADLDPRFPPKIAFAGAQHVIIAVHSRQILAQMAYDFDAVRALTLAHNDATISLIYNASPTRFYTRNPFPTGGIIEDPATGAAAAALAGYLRDINWAGENSFEILQGHDMGIPSRLQVHYTDTPGARITISGQTRSIEAHEYA